ncbi:RNA methyltransferase [uncultured Prevotella sp.]|nr:RNA methyltransferase [uncultured Prevotella sp.]
MLSKNQIKLVHSLQSKKGRDKEGCFVAEGPKVVSDLMEILKPKMFFATQGWIDSNPQIDNDIVVVTDDELRKISFLQHPQGVLAVFPMLVSQPKCDFDDSSLYIALDGVQDPGNLGTIIRVADWFGITKIFCSRNTADVYNPKVVQATMGSIARVRVEYCDLQVLFDSLPTGYPVYGTFLDGEDIYKKSLTPNGIIVMGNEGNGISAAMRSRINNRLLIPNFPEGRQTAESLNVAIATAITCSEVPCHMVFALQKMFVLNFSGFFASWPSISLRSLKSFRQSL